jgi:phosphodiesterase/alkaline phosphatase D-like protein
LLYKKMKTNKLILFFLFSGILIFITACKPEKEMLVSTGVVSELLPTSANVSGKILDRGEGVTQHGHCWGTAPNTTVSDSKTERGKPTADDFTSQLTGLNPNTKYYVRAYCSNGNQTVYGSEINFTTVSCAAPSATSDAATSVSSTLATLNGIVNANNSSTTVTFEYGPTTSYGSTITASTSPVSGSSNTPITATISGLTANTTYHCRVKAVNCGGTSNGNDQTFTTSCTAPSATTDLATSVSSTSATLNGAVNANNSSTTVTFEYGTTTSYGSTITATQSPVTGNNNTTVNAGLTGLTTNTTYHYKVKAVNCGGTSPGSDQTFTTSCAAAEASTNAVTGVSSTSATLNGTVNANSSSTVVTFECGTTTSYGSTITAAQSPVTGSSNTAVNAALSGLNTNATYHYRVKAVNCGGTALGGDQTFTTSCTAPSATTDAATNVSSTSATLNGTVNANNSSTTVTFDYGPTTSYGSTINASPSPVTGSTNSTVNAILAGLATNTIYHYRLKAVNCGGTSNGSDQTFTTSCSAPTATTDAATSVSSTSATLNSTINANNSATTVTFEYGVTTSYGSTITATQSPATGGINTTLSAGLAGLNSNTTYHFRVKAVNCGGTSYGTDQTFTTYCTAPVSNTNAATNVSTTSATLNGTINANNSSTTVTFEYGTSTSYGSTQTASPSPVSSNISTPVTAGISGLATNTIYHFRVKAVNCGGTSYGTDQTFTTICTQPTASTDAATNIGSSSATITGIANANNESTTVTFEYGTTTSYGSTITAIQSPIIGSNNTPVSGGLAGLTPNTQYHFRVKAVNCSSTPIYGIDQTFTTLCTASAATTEMASGIGTITATLNGIVNANSFSTIVSFEYGLNASYGSTIPATQSPVTGINNTAVSAGVTGLTSSTLYHYRLKAVNCGGTIYGIDQTFTTLCTAPSAVTNTAISIGTSSATLNGTVNANNFSTIVTFEYGTTTSYGNSITGTPSPVSGSSYTSVSADIAGLFPNILYHYRVTAISCGGTIQGADQTFTTLCTSPSASTGAASTIGITTATLNGTVNANNFSTTVTFEYGTTTSYGSSITALQSPVTGGSSTAVSVGVTTLSSNTLYHFRVKSINCGGTVFGIDQTFTTLCPFSLTVTHTSGNVAPVTKTLTYGIVQTNLSGQNKCWITKNLGADNQASSATDATETAAGWYWQFNRKQGFKHDGTTRTPSTTWITPINEVSDWTAATDPCTILLGTGWRIPTYTELTNADNNGGWINLNSVYASVLKLHATGYLYNGDLRDRGLTGSTWSSIQVSSGNGWVLVYSSTSSFLNNSMSKDAGFTVRCLRD